MFNKHEHMLRLTRSEIKKHFKRRYIYIYLYLNVYLYAYQLANNEKALRSYICECLCMLNGKGAGGGISDKN